MADDTERLFAERLRAERIHRGWSQGTLARHMHLAGWVNFHQTTVARIEKCERPVRLGEAVALAALLRKSVAQVLAAGEDTRTYADGYRAALSDVADLARNLGPDVDAARQIRSKA